MLNKVKYFGAGMLMVAMVACSNGRATDEKSANVVDIEVSENNGVALSLNSDDWKERQLHNPGVIIDVRTPDEWQTGTIAGANLINVFDVDFIPKVEAMQEDKDLPVFIYCRSGNRSKQALEILKKEGYTQIYELNQGIIGWEEDGNSITKK